MCSIRSGRVINGVVLAAIVAAAAAGCQRTIPPTTEKLNNAPLIVDEAMQRREWEPSKALYANGDTVAGGTGYMFQTHETIPAWANRVVDPAVSTGNILLLPVGVFVNSPFSKQQYQGAIIPPTHSGNPPLPAQ